MTDTPPTADQAGRAIGDRLNQDCFCIDVDEAKVWSAVRRVAGGALSCEMLAATRANMFSRSPVFLERADVEAMEAVVRAIEAAAELPGYREAALAWAPQIARFDPGPRGVFMGYDFHVTPQGPRLIEVNTNAGGAFLNALLAQGQVACCPEVQALAPVEPLAAFEAAVWSMFQDEWRLAGRGGAPQVVAIVDEAPAEQYLYPEFLLAQAFFERHGITALIADPAELQFRNGRLWLGERAVDLVYNRLVDFDLSDPKTAALREAYLAGAMVVTPNPRNHALLADKRNLSILSDPVRMRDLGLGPDHAEALRAVPRTVRVAKQDAAELWAQRRSLFFKPAGGHAAKAVYRGDKLTKGVWEAIVQDGDYVAQAIAPPSIRQVMVGGEPAPRKLDVRLYTYAGRTLLAAARLYAGQTTNFRTPGGGFAPVIVI